jgi:two-component system, LuxR family, sensor kinase FixL
LGTNDDRRTFDRMDYLNAILETLPDAVTILDADCRLMDINQAGLEKFGIKSIDDLPEVSTLATISPETMPVFLDRFEMTLRGDGDTSPIRVEIDDRMGVHRILECRMVLISLQDGANAGVLVASRDISCRDAQERQLAKEQSLLKAILDTVPDALIVIDEAGLITSFSKTAEVLFGYVAAEVLGRNVNMLMPSPHREAHDGYIRRYLQTGEKRIIGTGRNVEGRRRDGTTFPMELAVGEAATEDHRFFTGFVRDLTRQVETEVQLRLLESELAHASRLSAVGTLASALAHELNQPLTAVANYVSAGRDMMESDAPDTELVREALDEAASEAVRAGQIVRRLRDFVSNGDVERQNISLAQLIDDATTLGLVGAREEDVECLIDIDRDLGDVLADRVQIQQVMVNLMRNAVEAMEEAPVKQLLIRTRPIGEDQVEISVGDTGPGVSPEVRENLFRPFTSTKGQGMGLGLSICRTIVEAHGGRLSVVSEPECGTTFAFTLMRAARDQGEADGD